MRFRTSDPERNVMGQSTEMSPLVSMLFRTFLSPLKFLMKILYSKEKKALTFVLSSFTATVLEGLFGEYHSSSAALGQQRPKVTKQPLTCDWSATSEALCDVNRRFARNTEVKFVQGVNIVTVKDLARLPLRCHCT